MSFLLGRQVRTASFWECIWATRKVMRMSNEVGVVRTNQFYSKFLAGIETQNIVFFSRWLWFFGFSLTCPVHIEKNPSHCFCEVISLRWVLSFNRQLGRPTLTTGHPKTQFCFGCFLEHLSTIHFFQALGWTVPRFHLVCPPEGRGFKASKG